MNKIAENRKAYHEYEIKEKFDAGISLLGTEVKSIRERGVNLAGTYVICKRGEFYWVGAKIPPWQAANAPSNYKETRDRKLLLKKSEIRYLLGKSKEKRLIFVPLKLYNKGRWIKLEFGLGKKKKLWDKREKIKKREIERRIREPF